MSLAIRPPFARATRHCRLMAARSGACRQVSSVRNSPAIGNTRFRARFSPSRPSIWLAALIDPEGKLVGIGSLFVQDAEEENVDTQPGNMFVPVDLLKPIFESLIEKGRTEHPPRRLGITRSKPWHIF